MKSVLIAEDDFQALRSWGVPGGAGRHRWVEQAFRPPVRLIIVGPLGPEVLAGKRTALAI